MASPNFAAFAFAVFTAAPLSAQIPPPPDADLELSWVRADAATGQPGGFLVQGAEPFQRVLLAIGGSRMNAMGPFATRILVMPEVFVELACSEQHGGMFCAFDAALLPQGFAGYAQAFAVDPDHKRAKPLFSSNAMRIDEKLAGGDKEWNEILESLEAQLAVPDFGTGGYLFASVKVPSAGFGLELDRWTNEGGTVRVFLKVVYPGPTAERADRRTCLERNVEIEGRIDKVHVYLGSAVRGEAEGPRVWDLGARLLEKE